jgi:hypothetical protein
MKKWIDVVKEQFRLGKKTNPAYSLKNAMSDAKPLYNSLKKGVAAQTVKVRKVFRKKTKKRRFRKKGTKKKRRKGT